MLLVKFLLNNKFVFTLQAVGFSNAKQERNQCEQLSAFPSSMHEFSTPHMMHLMSISFVNYSQNRSNIPLMSGLTLSLQRGLPLTSKIVWCKSLLGVKGLISLLLQI